VPGGGEAADCQHAQAIAGEQLDGVALRHRQLGDEAGIVVDGARVEIVEVGESQHVLEFPHVGRLLLDGVILERQVFVAVVVGGLGIGVRVPVPTFGRLWLPVMM